jgi:hypothetical protein
MRGKFRQQGVAPTQLEVIEFEAGGDGAADQGERIRDGDFGPEPLACPGRGLERLSGRDVTA